MDSIGDLNAVGGISQDTTWRAMVPIRTGKLLLCTTSAIQFTHTN